MQSSQAQLSNRIRQAAEHSFVQPAREAGTKRVTISIREVMAQVGEESRGRQSVFCSALRAKKFLQANGLLLEKHEGPPKGRGTSVVYHYRFKDDAPSAMQDKATPMTAEAAVRLAEQYLAPLRGALAREIREFGGSEALIHWLRSEESAR